MFSLTAEKKLALKISIISFFVLLFILGSIILSGYIYSRNRALAEFNNEKRIFDGMRLVESLTGTPLPMNLFPGGVGKSGPKRGPRDIIIFDANKNIVKNDVLTLDNENIDRLFALETEINTTITLDDRQMLVDRHEVNGYTFFLLHDLTPLDEYYEQLLIIALFGSGLGFIIIFLMANHLAKITIAPIREHNRELESYSHNVAHELRTPLAVMRQNLELLKLKPSEKLILSTDEEISGMERIIDTLLFLAKPRENHLPKERVNIAKELVSILTPYEQNTISFHKPKKAVIVELRTELFKRVMNNLIENAIKYGSTNKISITLTERGISIENDTNTDLTPEEVQHLTKAFYQGDISRNSSGYGLGLALVAKIVEIEGWKMDIQAKNHIFSVSLIF